jgi:uncharacterized protein (DUF849 family)
MGSVPGGRADATSARMVNTIGPTGPVAMGQDNPRLLTQPHEIAFAVTAAYDAGAASRPFAHSRSGRRS